MKKCFIIVLSFLFFLAVFVSCSNRGNIDVTEQMSYNISPVLEEESINKYTPFFWGYTDDENLFNDIDNVNSTYLHPLDLGRKALYAIYTGNLKNDSILIQYGEKYLSFLIDYPYTLEDSTSVVYKYSFAHNELEAQEWWSGMANSVIALAFLEGYEVLGDTIYYQRFEKSINGVIEDVSEIGSSIKLGSEETWFLEYVHANSNPDNSYFVLNGFSFSLLAIDIIYEKTQDVYYLKAYNSGVEAFKNKEKEFYYTDNIWTNYMLNPLTIESAHYSIYDLLLFKSLLCCTKNDVFVDEVRQRQQILLNTYPIFKKRIDDQTVFLFSSIGPPHPYWIDVYQIELRYYNDNELVLKHKLPPKDFDIDIKERAFLLDTIESGYIDSVAVFALYNDDTLNLYKIGVKNIETIYQNQYEKKNFELATLNDMERIDDFHAKMLVNGDDNQKLTRGTLRLLMDEELDINKYRLFGIEFLSDIEISNVRITLLDQNSRSVTRYYVSPEIGNSSLLLFNKLGFEEIEYLDCEAIAEIRIDVYAENIKSNEDLTCEISSVCCFQNNFQLFNYFNSNEFVFPEFKVRGNIY